MIKRISRILRIATFQDFSWDTATMPDFKKHNLFYGWNGSGKTTLARILAMFKTGILNNDLALFDPQVVLKMSDESKKQINGGSVDQLPNVEVFNQDFVEENVSFEKGKTKGILMISQEKETQKETLVELRKTIHGINEEMEKCKKRIFDSEKELKSLLETAGIFVKNEMLSYTGIRPLGNGPLKYSTYDKRGAEDILVNKKTNELRPEEVTHLKETLVNREELPPVDELIFNLDWIEKFYSFIETNQKQQVDTKVVDSKVVENPQIFEWLKRGYELHEHLEHEKSCEFCTSKISDERWSYLSRIFDERFKALANAIETQLSVTKENINKIGIAPDSNKFYKNLQVEYLKKMEIYNATKKRLIDHISSAREELRLILTDPTKSVNFEVKDLKTSLEDFIAARDQINIKISEHNRRSKELNQIIENAAHTLECVLLEKYKEGFERIKIDLLQQNEQLEKIQKILAEKNKHEKQLESQLSNEAIGAQELGKMLREFFGNDEINVEPSTEKGEEGGYILLRKNGVRATYLSEGEKNAIALIFFLTNLRKDGFDRQNSIVVIDDPVSSFDYNNLFQAFSFIKSQLQEIKPAQIFIFTHNFQFFKQTHNWFDHESKENPCYTIEQKLRNNSRVSTIRAADNFLLKYNSEYSYLFSLIYRKARIETETDLEKDYILPNAVRRLLENFLSFRVPTSRSLNQRFKDAIADFEESGDKVPISIRTRLEKYCHDGSHGLDQQSLNDLDEVLQGEIKAVCADSMNFIEQLEPKHFFHLKNEVESV